MKKTLFALVSIVSLALMGCNSEKMEVDIKVSPESITLYSEGTAQITTNVSGVSFESVDPFYASVDQSGLVTANKVGSTSISVKKSGTRQGVSIPVQVLSKYSLYPDVDGLVGKGLNDVTRVLGNSYETSSTTDGKPMYVFQKPTSYATLIGVSFSNNKCESVIVVVSTSFTSMLSKHLVERYNVAGMQNDFYFFLNHDKSVIIGLSVYNSNYLAVLYTQNTSSKANDRFNITEYHLDL